MSTDALCWVESPLQLLSTVEAFALGVLSDRAVVYPRLDVPGLARTAQIVSGLDLPAGLSIAPAAPTAPLPRPGAVWALGDVHSGRAQTMLARAPITRLSRFVLVDDGLSTIHTLTQLVGEGGPFTRAHGRTALGRRILGSVTMGRLRRIAASSEFTLVTALDLPLELQAAIEEMGGTVVRHQFEWSVSQPSSESVDEAVVVIGSALAADGLVLQTAYEKWVLSVADRGPAVYFPHRREDPEFLRRLATHPHLRVTESGLPVEYRLRGLGERHEVHCLPSTPHALLPVVIHATGAHLQTHRVPDSWWTRRASMSFREHLNSRVKIAEA